MIQAMLDSARELCGSLKVRRKNPNSVHLNDVKAAVKKKKVA